MVTQGTENKVLSYLTLEQCKGYDGLAFVFLQASNYTA